MNPLKLRPRSTHLADKSYNLLIRYKNDAHMTANLYWWYDGGEKKWMLDLVWGMHRAITIDASTVE